MAHPNASDPVTSQRSEIRASLDRIEGPELFFGFVGPIGTNLILISEVLREQLADVKYDSTLVRLSDLIRGVKKFADLPTTPADERWRSHMKAGTELRRTLESGDAVAKLAISKIVHERKTRAGGGDHLTTLPRHAFILHSLKRPEEVATLRRLYGKAFILISAYSPRNQRIESISTEIAESRNDSDKTAYRDKAEELARRDEDELEETLGQDVTDAYPKADLFVRADVRSHVDKSVGRFVEILFGYPFHTPTKDEFGMFCAKAVSLRSAALGRQVGAAICSDEGDVIAVGCNDVAKAGGGLYWPDDKKDYRDFQLGSDVNTKTKIDILSELLDRLYDAGLLKMEEEEKKDAKASLRKLATNFLTGGPRPMMAGSRLMNLIEFSRELHAEMAALTDASRRGISVRGATLYSTTFPCHLCAKHIVAAGIKRVVYIEPYPKSLTRTLYPDSIAVDEETSSDDHVRFESFVGVAPRRYMDFFEMRQRKTKDGSVVEWSKQKCDSIIERVTDTYLLVEKRTVSDLLEQMTKHGLN